MSPADSGSPRAARRQEPLHGHSSVQAPQPAKRGHALQAAPTQPSGPLELPASALHSRASVPQEQAGSDPQVLPDSGPHRLDSVRQQQAASAPPRADPVW